MNVTAMTNAGFKNSAGAADTERDPRLRQACADFEAIMLEKFLRMARESAPKEGLLSGGHAEQMYRSLHDQELAQQMAAGEGMGFGEMLYRQITQQHYSR
ncbi:rod-binding protein [Desulfurivibrio sp. D14AmB]|uniref:rod-binding protein n=1 Tax=Desulfurivibrio sp. D14AmB TaxID=3374370 RepID=UPI00376EF461